MREPLQNGAPLNYERPNQPWICGLACEGRACPAGPTAAGRCPALAECSPVRDGDRWQCNRSALRGGPCEEGPTPEGGCCLMNRCHPVRSLRDIRGRFVAACTLATAGGLLILLSANWRDGFISPGPLARQHAQLLARGGAAHDCSACHSAANDGLGGWTTAALFGDGNDPTQSQLCMKCHENTINANLSLAAHNLPPQQLLEIRKKGSGLFSNDANNSPDPFSMACAACHREHHGAEFDLTSIDNASCQACHHERYESFAGDHPDFGVWPYERRTRIVFDHASHQSKHFVDKREPFDCRACHVSDATHTTELLVGYEQACASCHDEKIMSSMARGTEMFVLPMLDVDAFHAAGLDIGAWPAKASGEFDGRLPPAMKLLLAADRPAAQAMATLGADFEFIDVDPDDPSQLKAAADLAIAIKKLLAELSQTGPAAVRERLQTALGREISDAQLNALLAGLSVDTLRPAVAAWLPNVDAGNRELPAAAGNIDVQRPLAFAPAGSWTRDDATLSIRYRLTGHADPVLAEWLSLLVETPGVDKMPIASALRKELAKPTAPGLCASCHSVEHTPNGQLAVNWRAFDRSREPRTFTKFSHGPHLSLPELADCTACHALDTSSNTAASYADADPHHFVSEFAPLSKHDCAACHAARAAGDSCQSCHRYHVESVEDWR